jgi:predicted SprT family Zn-dependent metalloprotease
MRINEVQQKESYETPKLPKETFKKPLTSNKKTPLNSKKPESSAKSTPRWQEICDPETSSSEDEYEEESSAESNDEDFNPNETWNASSDEDEDVESDDDEEKVQKPKRKTKSHKDEEMIFVPPSTVKKSAIKTLADFEFKEPPKMPGIATPKKHSKRKLFTHTHYEDEEESNNEIDKIQTKDNDKENVNIMTPLQIPSITTIKKITPKDKILTSKGQVKKTPILSTSHSMKFEKYSFLKSLDVETTCKSLCDPEALYYRDNYKIKKVELAQKLHQIYNENIFNGELKDLEIKWNKKLLNTAGRCNNSRKCGERKSFLELSDKVLTSADRLRCTLIHEMCHAATWIFNGENGHGVRWKMWAAKANKVFPELPKISVCHSYVIDYRYTYKCVNCNAKHQAHSKSKKVENIRCSICKSAIEIFLNKKNKNGEIVMTPVAKEVKGFPKFVKMKFKDVKKPNMTHKEVMQILSQQYAALSVEEKQMLMA